MEVADLSWRAEEACLNAWPSTHTVFVAGYLARISGGPIRRTNSVNPTRSASVDPARILGELRRLYGDAGQPLIFRVPTIAGRLDEALSREGFQKAEDETVTLHAPLFPAHPANEVKLSGSPSREWLRARAEMSGADAATSAIYERMLGLVRCPIQFASIRNAGTIAAMAYGVVSRGMLVIESVATQPEMRRLGFGKNTVAALMAWAANAGVTETCLQVIAANTPARGLYDGLGFSRELYRYHYRRG